MSRMSPRNLRRLVLVLLVTVSGVLIPAASADAFEFPNPFDGCKTAPAPSLPALSVQIPPSVNNSGKDPFTDPGVSIESVYGWGYRWFSYDNGCKPGSGIAPSFGADFGTSVGLKPGAWMGSLAHAMQSAAVNPTWLKGMDSAVTEVTQGLRDSVWANWVAAIFAVVAVLMLWRARAGRLDRTVTTGAWALLVLLGVTYTTNYPVEAGQMVDEATSYTVTEIATSFSPGHWWP